jgi:DNA-binding transcriptional regulator YhcF (GntR family)
MSKKDPKEQIHLSKEDRIIALLEEALIWLKFIAGNFREVLIRELTEDTDKIIYELSNGLRTTRQIAKLSGVNHTTVANKWKKWHELGIVREASAWKGRFEHLCSLKEMGMHVTGLPEDEQKIEEEVEAEAEQEQLKMEELNSDKK